MRYTIMKIDYDKLIEESLHDRDVLDQRISELEKQKKEQDEYERTKVVYIDLDNIRQNGIADFSAENFADIMRAIDYESDKEQGHILADKAMVEFLKHLGYGNGCDIFNNMSKWYS